LTLGYAFLKFEQQKCMVISALAYALFEWC